MKREDIKNVFDRIEPDISAKERMLDNVLNHSKKRKENTMLSFNFKKAIPALALAVVFAGGILTYSLKDKLFGQGFKGEGSPEIPSGEMISQDSASGREDAIAPMLDQFQFDGRNYILMSDDLRAEYGFPAAIDEGDIGQRLMTIEKSPDERLIGCEVFSYVPAGGEAIVAVKRDNGYELFKFFTFESYNNNQDEDAIEYLKLYGIKGPEDISKIQFIVHTEQSKLEGFTNIKGEITDRNEIAGFYSFYSVLKNSSDKYFEKLFGYYGTGNSTDVEIDVAYPEVSDDKYYPDERDVEPVAPDRAPAPNPAPAPDYDQASDYNGTAEEIDPAYPNHKGVAEDLPLGKEVESRDAVISSDAPVALDLPADAVITGSDTPVAVEIERGEGNSSSSGASQGMTDKGEAGMVSGGTTQGSAGNALADPVTIRIYNQNGVYFDSIYYMNIGFISRYEVTAEFAAFIENYIK